MAGTPPEGFFPLAHRAQLHRADFALFLAGQRAHNRRGWINGTSAIYESTPPPRWPQQLRRQLARQINRRRAVRR